jgi:hypothetical protein
MSKHVNMTGHYKVAGRERQGEDIIQSSQKGAFARQRQQARREAIESQSGPPAWEATPPNFEIADRPKAAARKTRKAKKAKTLKGRKNSSTRAAKRARKATPRRKPVRATSRPARRQSRSA